MAGRKKNETQEKPTLAALYAAAEDHKGRVEAASLAATEVEEMSRRQTEVARQEQAERERRIAQSYQLVGRIQGAKMVADFGNVAGFMWLREVHREKLYRDMPGIETWEKFCESVGMSRRKIEDGIANLETFGEEFMATVAGFRVSHRDLRKLRQLTHDGAVAIEDQVVLIGGEAIPLDAEHRDDLQAALERVIEAKDQLLQEKDATVRTKDKLLQAKEDLLRRQEKELSRYEKEAEKAGLTPTEDAFIKRMENLRVSFDGYMLKVDPERSDLRFEEAERTPRMVAAYLTTLDYMRKQLLAAYDIAQDMYGSAVMTPEEAWKQPEE